MLGEPISRHIQRDLVIGCLLCVQLQLEYSLRVESSFATLLNSAQVQVLNANGTLVVSQGTTDSCSSLFDCGGLSTNSSVSSFWEQCCTTNLCNNVTIPFNVASLAALEQLYLGMTPAECYGIGAPSAALSFA